MYPPIFAACLADMGVTALLGTNPLRVYMFGKAPQNAVKPYAVWQVVTGNPENYINQRPDADRFTLQVDIYAKAADEARSVAQSISYAVELNAHVTSWRGESRDNETKDYRSSFDIDWIVQR